MSARRAAELAYADTNLFVALFAGTSHPLHERALDLFRRVSSGDLRLVLTAVVVAELVYVAESLLAWKRSVIGRRLGELLEADGLVVPQSTQWRGPSSCMARSAASTSPTPTWQGWRSRPARRGSHRSTATSIGSRASNGSRGRARRRHRPRQAAPKKSRSRRRKIAGEVETFIVRVWAPEPSVASADSASSDLRGVVRRVRDGHEASFSSWEELRPFLEPVTDGDGAHIKREGRRRGAGP